MQRLHMIISGSVQGVFFRYHTKKVADRLGVTGWVRNTADGGVEVVAEGDEEKLEELLKFCQRGPSIAHVDNVNLEKLPATGEFSNFDIRYF